MFYKNLYTSLHIFKKTTLYLCGMSTLAKSCNMQPFVHTYIKKNESLNGGHPYTFLLLYIRVVHYQSTDFGITTYR